MKDRFHKFIDHGASSILLTIFLGWVGWVTTYAINAMIAQAKSETKLDNLTSSIEEIKSDLKDFRDLALPRLGVNPRIREFISTSTTAQNVTP
jgi:hypothetical protein